MSKRIDDMKKLREKYTSQYYKLFKAENKCRWKDIPFRCHNCGKAFHVDKVKPKNLPINCSPECRDARFDPSVGAILSAKIMDLDWKKIQLLINAGKTGPEIAKTMGVALATLHKYVKKKLSIKVLTKMTDSGKKRRKTAQLLVYSAKKESIDKIVLSSPGKIGFGTGGHSEKLVITGNNSVSLGCPNPTTKLEIPPSKETEG